MKLAYKTLFAFIGSGKSRLERTNRSHFKSVIYFQPLNPYISKK